MSSQVQPPVEEVDQVDPAAVDAARARKEKIGRYVGMLIFPFLMVSMMVTGYLGAMHAPTPHVTAANPSSVIPSQSSSMLLHVSVAPEPGMQTCCWPLTQLCTVREQAPTPHVMAANPSSV